MPYEGLLRLDPDATLARVRLLIAATGDAREGSLMRELGDLIGDLDEWLTHGGVLPHDWIASRRRAADRVALTGEAPPPPALSPPPPRNADDTP